MLTNEDLQAISDLFDKKFDEKFDEKIKPIQHELSSLKNEKHDILLTMSDMLDKKIKPIKYELDHLKNETHDIRMLLENDAMPRLKNIESCYMDTYERYAVGAEEMEAMKVDAEIMKKLLQEHQTKLKAL